MEVRDALLQGGLLFLAILLVSSVVFYIGVERRVLRPIIEVNRALQDVANGHHLSGQGALAGAEEATHAAPQSL